MVGENPPAGSRVASGGPARLWTAAEANVRLPALRELLPHLRTWAGRLGEVQAELARLARFWGEELRAHDRPDHDLQERLEAEGRNLAHRLEEGIGALRAEGIEIKHLESGLVDFYALVEGRLAFLCWRADEPAVAFYHALEGGYATRRPLPSGSARSVPTGARGTAESPRGG